MSRRLALIVANDSYRDEGLAALYAPVYEARQLGELLRDPEIGGFDLVDILPNESKPEIERQLERMFASAEPGDLIALYFSGHGVRSRNGELHLAVSNTDLSLLASTSVAASFIRNRIDESDASSTVLLLDCCYSGAFTDGGRGTLKADPQINVGTELSAGRGIYVLTATSSVQSASDGQPESAATPRTLSAFTEAVVRGLSTGAADVRGMGRITPNDLWEYVRQEVPSRTTRQTPTQYGYVEDEVHLANVRRTFPTAAVSAGGTRVHLGDLLGTLTQTADKGLRAEEWQGSGRLVVPIGQVLRGNERAEPVWLDLAHTDGHVLVVGRIGSGKSTLLRTLVGALAVTHSPDEARLYFLESGGNKLGSLRRLPAFARMAGDEDADHVVRLLDEIHTVIDQRKRLFRDYDIDSASMFRAVRAELPGGPHPDLFLFVDRWPEFADHAQRILRVASGGLEYGVHLVVTARSWREVPDELEELVHCRIELGLSQPADSHIDRQLAAQLPPDRPGWALLRRSRFLIALPELRTAIGTPAEVWANETADGALELVDRVIQAWSRTLPYAPPPPPLPLHPVDQTPWRSGGAGSPPPVYVPAPPIYPPPAPTGPPGGGPQFGGNGASSPTGPEPGEPAADAEQGGWPEPPAEPPLQRTTSRPLGAPAPSILDLLGIDPSRPLPVPSRRAPRDRLLVPIGIDTYGSRVELDLKESAQGGMGPHGLLIGATGSGKSELVRTLISALALTHEPDDLNLLLVDFKGSTTFAPFRALPHLVGLVTNLADDVSHVDRLADVVTGELTRRQELLRQAGNYASHRDYEKARDGGAPLEPLPSLLVVVDEFSELLSAKPDFIDLFVMIGRLGRSLGVHLLLASQRLEEGKLRGLDTHLSYRIGLRTFSAMESRTVLGVPDAYELPKAPGNGYLHYGPGSLVRFLAAASFRPMPDSGGETLSAAEAVTQAQRGLRPARPIWLPPLDRSPLLDELVGPVTVDASRGLSSLNPHLRGSARVPVGVLDKPHEQVQEPLCLPIGDRTNTVVVGGPRSGKSTFVQTFVCALALTYTPAEVHVYGLDLDGGGLGELRDLPHVGGVADRRDYAMVRRTVADVAATLAQREAALAPAEGWPHVFLVIDGWSTFRQEFDDLEVTITDLAAQGPENGIYLVLTAQRSIHLRAALRDLFWSRFELRLSDPSDSDLNRRIAATVPTDRPGRGITRDGHHFLTALPSIAGEHGPSGLSGLVDAVARSWPGPNAPAVRQLPQLLPYAELDLDAEPGQPLTLPIGIAETDLSQVGLDFAADPHLLIVGDPGSGKSALLRSLAATIAYRLTPEQAAVVMVDPRRGQAAPASRAPDIDALLPLLQGRLPASDVTPQQLRERSWWSGPDVFVLVDDYNLFGVSGAPNPLQPLLEYLPQARDIGLHLVLARSANGISRAIYEPIVQTVRELVSPTLVLSGNPDEGFVISRVRPTPQPPGRGWLFTRREGTRLVQLAYEPDPADDPPS